jgi:hypothetical protein
MMPLADMELLELSAQHFDHCCRQQLLLITGKALGKLIGIGLPFLTKFSRNLKAVKFKS